MDRMRRIRLLSVLGVGLLASCQGPVVTDPGTMFSVEVVNETADRVRVRVACLNNCRAFVLEGAEMRVFGRTLLGGKDSAADNVLVSSCPVIPFFGEGAGEERL